MKITHIQLLDRTFTPKGRCLAKVRLVGTDGQSIRLDVDVPGHESGRQRALNAAIAQDAMRQLMRLPEYRDTPPEALEFAMPLPPNRRVVRL